MLSPVGKHVVGGGSAAEARLSGPSDGAGDRGDPPALPGQEAAHPRRHRGQKTKAAELLKDFSHVFRSSLEERHRGCWSICVM